MRRYSIGRATTNDIVLDDMTVSRSHAELEELGRGRFILRDQESTYGTKILRDGEWVEIIEVEVATDTLIRFGELETTLAELITTVDADATHMPRRGPAPVEPNSERHAPAAATPASPAPVAPAPAAPKAKKAKTPKAPKLPKMPKVSIPDGPGAPDKRMTMLILFGGGGAAALIVLIGLVLAFVGGPGGTTTGTTLPGGMGNIGGGGGGGGGGNSGGRSDFMAACKQAKRPDAECSCSWTIMRDKLNETERGIFISIVKNRTNATKLVELTKGMSAEARKAFFQKVSAVAREIKGKCEKS